MTTTTTQADKRQADLRQPAANCASVQRRPTVQGPYLGTAAHSLGALQRLANQSPQARKTAQLRALADRHAEQGMRAIQRGGNGLPENLRSGVESLSGYAMDDVKVFYNSSKPAQLQAHAFAQGTHIHLAAGQERHLPHEAWHVVQQKQGRVKPTAQLRGMVNVNDDAGLEAEADVMGAKAMQLQLHGRGAPAPVVHGTGGGAVLQAYNISYGALQNGAGTDMHVYIDGKNDPDLHNGTPPSVVPAWWPAAGTELRNYLAQYAVQGHLLNEHLGGPGNNIANLTPITKSTNATHFQAIERIVKQAIADDYGVEYRVRATYGHGPSLADFGPAPPPGLAPLLSGFAETIGADYDIYDRHTATKLKGAPGELLIKNEGKHLKGTF